ncbi:hypothetical protein MASR2M70_15880 [Bacillota bacterium]
MEIIRSTREILPYNSRVFNEYFGGLTMGVIDIETDGLNPSYCKVILGGLLTLSGNQADIIQYFAREKQDEEELLQAYANAFASCDILLTYNGERFDLPFIRQRSRKYQLDPGLEDLQSLDLYRVINNYSNFRDFLPDLKQKSIERFLGLSELREDEISGAESVELYRYFLKTGSEESRRKILLHNRDDLVQLSSLMRVLDKLDLHRVAFHEGFTVTAGDKKAIVKRIDFSNGSLNIKGRTSKLSQDYYSFDSACRASHRAKEKELMLTIPYEKKQGAIFIDLEAFGLDFSALESYPAWESGYLILRDKDKVNCAEINKTIKIILSEILSERML